MKKYTQPTVEITAFDFEDITMSSINAENYEANVTEFKNTTAANTIVVDAYRVEW